MKIPDAYRDQRSRYQEVLHATGLGSRARAPPGEFSWADSLFHLASRASMLSLSDSAGSRAVRVVLERRRFIGCTTKHHETAATASVAMPNTIKRNEGMVITNRSEGGSHRVNTIATRT